MIAINSPQKIDYINIQIRPYHGIPMLKNPTVKEFMVDVSINAKDAHFKYLLYDDEMTSAFDIIIKYGIQELKRILNLEGIQV